MVDLTAERDILLRALIEMLAAEGGEATSRTIKRVVPKATKKAKRKVSAYQRRFGVELKRLKKKHPRTATSALMKRAHRATKKVMRK